MGRFVDLDKEGFIDREALLATDRRPRLVGLKAHGEIQAGTTVALDGQPAGWLTATAFSPYLGHHVAYALFETAGDWIGRQVTCGDDRVPGETLDLPFYDPEKQIPRGKVNAQV